MLVKRKEEQEEYKEIFGDEYTDYKLVFAMTNGRPMEGQVINRAFRKLINDHGLPKVVFHSLRHPYVKHTTKKYNSEKQKTQATKIDLIAWVFRFCTFNYSKRSWTL